LWHCQRAAPGKRRRKDGTCSRRVKDEAREKIGVNTTGPYKKEINFGIGRFSTKCRLNRDLVRANLAFQGAIL